MFLLCSFFLFLLCFIVFPIAIGMVQYLLIISQLQLIIQQGKKEKKNMVSNSSIKTSQIQSFGIISIMLQEFLRIIITIVFYFAHCGQSQKNTDNYPCFFHKTHSICNEQDFMIYSFINKSVLFSALPIMNYVLLIKVVKLANYFVKLSVLVSQWLLFSCHKWNIPSSGGSKSLSFTKRILD